MNQGPSAGAYEEIECLRVGDGAAHDVPVAHVALMAGGGGRAGVGGGARADEVAASVEATGSIGDITPLNIAQIAERGSARATYGVHVNGDLGGGGGEAID